MLWNEINLLCELLTFQNKEKHGEKTLTRENGFLNFNLH